MDDSRIQPKTRLLMMPRDTNPAGTIFGGVILSYIDQAGAEEARYHGAERVVTVAMKEVVFLQPVFSQFQIPVFQKLVSFLLQAYGLFQARVRVSPVQFCQEPDVP